MNEPWRICLFGGLSARRGEARVSRFRTQKNASLLAFLAYHRDRSHPREVLIDLLWPDHELEAGRNCLSVALSSLRSQFEGPDVPAKTVIVADRATVRLNPDTVVTDAHEFKQFLRKAEKSASDVEKMLLLDSAVGLYAGPLLPGYYEEWVPSEQNHLAETFFQALGSLIDHARGRGDLPGAIAYARRGAAVDPLREDVQLLLIELLAEAGRPVEAVQHYRDLIAVFQEQTGLPPGPQLQETAAVIESRLSVSGRSQSPSSRSKPKAAASPPVPPVAQPPASGILPTLAPALPVGTVTILAAEVIPGGASADASGESQLREAISLALRTNGAGVLALQGRSARAVFGGAADALTAALQIQRTLQQGDLGKVRLVLDTGDIAAAGTAVEASAYDRMADHATLILAAAHPGQTVITEATAALLRRDPDPNVALRDLGVFRFARQAERVAMAIAPGLADDFPRLNAATGESPSVPISVNRFFGRLIELEELDRMISEPGVRLVTLTGPGGVGKTRLASEVARRMVDRFDGRVYFAALPDNGSADALPRAILTALRIAPNPARDALSEAVDALSSAPSLVVFDNFDQLVETASLTLLDLLTRAPGVTCLVTSRRPLDLSLEQEYRVAPLPLPPLDAPLARLASAEALQFFVDRARAVRPDFQLTKANAETLGRVCVALEGIPLAIELAAARVSVLTERQILSQLDNRLRLLSGGKRDSHRHRTMRSTIEWSYDLLPDELRTVFQQLSVFRGGFTLDAATEVCELPDLFDQLWQLRQYSLLQVDTTSNGLRFRMLEMVREFASDLLAQTGQADSLREKHWSFFYHFAHQACAEVEGENPGVWLDQMEQDHDNLLLALDYPATENRRLYFCYCLHRFWIIRGYIDEGRRLTAEMLARCPDADANWKAMAQAACGALEWAAGSLDTAREHMESALTLTRAAGLADDEKYALNNLGLVLAHQGRYAEAMDRFREVIALVGRDDPIYAIALGNLAKAEANVGDHQAARAHQEECISILAQSGQRLQLSLALTNYGHLLRDLGEYDAAHANLCDGSLICYEMRDRSSYPHCLFDTALVAMHCGDPETSAFLMGGSERLKKELGIQHDPETARRIADLVEKLRVDLGGDRWSSVQEQAAQAAEEDLLKAARDVAAHHARGIPAA